MLHGLVLSFYLLLSGVLFPRLFAAWTTAIPGGLQDTRLFLWNAWWFRHAIDVLKTDPFFTPLLLHPFGASLIPHDYPLWNNLVTYAAQRAGQNLAGASNLGFVLSWVFAGFFAYLLAWEVTRLRGPAIVAGIYVMTHSYTLARAMQNWGQFNLYGIALFLWLLTRARRLGRARDFIAAGIALAWTAACHYYFLIYSGVIWLATFVFRAWPIDVRLEIPPNPPLQKGGLGGFLRGFFLALALLAGGIAVLIIARPGVREIGGHTIPMHTPANALLIMWLAVFVWVGAGFRLKIEPQAIEADHRRHRFRMEGLLILTALACLSPLLWRTFQLILQGGYPKQSILWKTHLTGASLVSLVLPNPVHAVWGQGLSAWLMQRGIQPQDQAASIGWVLLAVLVLSRFWTLDPRAIRGWLTLAVSTTVLSMGTYLHILEWNLWMPLPFYVWRLIPVLGNVRVPERWMAVGAIAWGVVLAIALACLARRKNWPLNRLCCVVAAAILLENWPGVPLGTLPQDNPVFQKLKSLPRGGVLPLPLYVGDSSVGAGNAPPGFVWESLASQIYHQQPMVGGYLGRISRDVIKKYKADAFFLQLLDLEEEKSVRIKALTTQEACRSMKKFAVNYVLIYPNAINPLTFNFIHQSLPLRPIAASGDVQLQQLNCR